MQKFLILALLALFAACKNKDAGHFQSVVQALPEVKLPFVMAINREEGADLGPVFTDSLFIVRFLDSTFFETPAGDRTYAYHQGFRVSSNDRHTALLFPFGTNTGIRYELLTYTPQGRLIDRISLGSDHPEILELESVLEPGGALTNSWRTYEHWPEKKRWGQTVVSRLQIRPDGKITETGAPALEDWSGEWHFANDIYRQTGTLKIDPSGENSFDFNIAFVYGPGANARIMSGKAQVEGRMAVYAEEGCFVFFNLEKDRFINVFHPWVDQCDQTQGAAMDGIYSKKIYDRILTELPDSAYASCFVYTMEDSQGNPVGLPPAVKKGLDCPVLLGNSPDRRYLCFGADNRIALMDFERNQVVTLVDTPFEKLDGASGPLWSPDGKHMAIVLINQQDFLKKTRLHVFNLEDGKITGKKQFEAGMPFVCASTCFVIPGETFWFHDEKTIGYQTEDGETGEGVRWVDF